MKPIFNEAIEPYKDSVDVNTIDITKDVQKAIENGVMGIPAHFVVDIEGNGYFHGSDITSAMKRVEDLLQNN